MAACRWWSGWSWSPRIYRTRIYLHPAKRSTRKRTGAKRALVSPDGKPVLNSDKEKHEGIAPNLDKSFQNSITYISLFCRVIYCMPLERPHCALLQSCVLPLQNNTNEGRLIGNFEESCFTNHLFFLTNSLKYLQRELKRKKKRQEQLHGPLQQRKYCVRTVAYGRSSIQIVL